MTERGEFDEGVINVRYDDDGNEIHMEFFPLEEGEHWATLTRGSRYAFGVNPGIVFINGIRKKVDGKTKQQLQMKAVDERVDPEHESGEGLERIQKFKFSRVGDPEPVVSTRRRAAPINDVELDAPPARRRTR